MSILERLFSVGIIRKGLWRLWYPFLTRRLRADKVYFLEIRSHQDISAAVLRGMDRNAQRNKDLVCQRLPKFLHTLGCDFAGVPGYRVYEALRAGGLSYRAWGWERK